MDTLKAVFDAVKDGGPVALSCVLFYMWLEERKEKTAFKDRSDRMEDKILDNLIMQTQAMTKLEASITSLKDLFNQMMARLQ